MGLASPPFNLSDPTQSQGGWIEMGRSPSSEYQLQDEAEALSMNIALEERGSEVSFAIPDSVIIRYEIYKENIKLMRHRHSREVTFFVAVAGKSPITLSIQPRSLLAWGGLLVATPILSFSVVIYSLWRQNLHLTQENAALTQTAADVLTHLESLDTEMNALRERAGMSETPDFSGDDSSELRGQGEPATQLSAEEMLHFAADRLPILMSRWKERVKPLLEDTLEEETEAQAAFPSGIPLKVAAETSSEFGLRPNPFGGGYGLHEGIDFLAAYGIPFIPQRQVR
jgi:murein DD-endopeptidase MepM/ murein hydrolase activator NlpD